MDDIIKYILEEDIGFGDITSNTLIPEDKCFDARIVSREEGILAGVEIIKSLFQEYGIEVISSMNDGDGIAEGDVILELSGNARTILTLERTALNLLMRMCGVATSTNRVAGKVREVNPKIRIAGTRKTMPALKRFDKLAIAIGGGDTHRYSLDDMVSRFCERGIGYCKGKYKLFQKDRNRSGDKGGCNHRCRRRSGYRHV